MSQAFEKHIRVVPDWPHEGVTFKDFTPILADPVAFSTMMDAFAELVPPDQYTHICAMDARGFIFGSALALKLQKPLILIRKKGKLPGEVEQSHYTTEYSDDCAEIHVGALQQGDKTLIVDDLIATGGTLAAAIQLVKSCGAEPVAVAALMDLSFCGGSKKLRELVPEVKCILNY